LAAYGSMGWQPIQWRDTAPAPERCRVAIVYDDAMAPVDDAIQNAMRELADFLRQQGVKVIEDARPVDSRQTHRVYVHLVRSATGAWLDAEVYDKYKQHAQARAADDDSFAAMHYCGSTLSYRDWVAFDEQRAVLRRQWRAFFESYDLIITPVACSAAFPHMQTGERWERMVGLPATAIPLGLSAHGLPVGAQIIGPAFSDSTCLRFAQWLEREWRGFVAPAMATSSR
jgi:amidase